MPSQCTRRRKNDLLRMVGAAATALLLATTALAQTAPNAPRLVQTGRVFACGNGIAGDLCFVTPDSKRVLVLGRERDAVWLDLPARQVLRHLDPPDREFERVQVDASEPWLVWLAADGRGLRIDLDTGQRTDLGREQVDQLPKTGWLDDGRPWQGESATSPNGKFRVALDGDRWQRHPFTGRRFPAGWIANDGIVLTTDQDDLVLWGVNPLQTRRIPLLFCGSPTRLAFTTDGSYLAVMSGPQVQVVDAIGQQIAVLPGDYELTAGTANDEFWLVGDGTLRRWSASAPTAAIEPPAESRLWKQRDHVLVHKERVWSANLLRTLRAIGPKEPTGKDESLEQVLKLLDTFAGESLGLAASDAKDAVFLLMTSRRLKSSEPEQTFLCRFDRHSKLTQEVELEDQPLWLTAVRDGTHVAVGMFDGTVQLFDCETLQLVKQTRFARRLFAPVARNPAEMLASIGDRLQRIDAKTLEVLGDIALPAGLPRVDQLVASPDGRRLAITCGSEVRILTIE